MEKIHVRFDFGEAVRSKRALLGSEMHLINIARKVRDYRKLRQEELLMKAKIKTKISKALNDVKSLIKNLPAENLKKEKKEVNGVVIEKEKKGRLEDELKKIKEKLESLKI